MKWTKALMVGSFVLATASVWACGDDDPAPEDPCPKDDPLTDRDESECAYYATAAAGAEALEKRQCKTCHGPDMAGLTEPLKGKKEYEVNNFGFAVRLYPPNLTNDATGIASWADDEVVIGIREGYDRESVQLCPQMTHYTNMSDFEAFSIVKYLRSLPPVSKTIPNSVCPPLKQEGR